MRLDDFELEQIAQRVAEIVTPRIKESAKVLVSIYDIEDLCSYKKDSKAVKEWVSDKTFPQPVMRSGHRRWFLSEVIEWLKQRREAETMAMLVADAR